MTKYILIDTTFFEGEYPGVFDYIEMDETGNSLRQGQILMKPDIDFEAEYQHGTLTDGDGNVIDDDFGLDDEEVEAIRKDYEESPLWKCQSFPEAYPKLKEILDQPDSVIFGMSAKDDEFLLNMTCRRYGLPEFDFFGKNLKSSVNKMIHNVMQHNESTDATEDLTIAASVVNQICEADNRTILELLAE